MTFSVEYILYHLLLYSSVIGHDVFCRISLKCRKFRMFIYDRWGNEFLNQLILTQVGRTNKNNGLCQSGVYVYKLYWRKDR